MGLLTTPGRQDKHLQEYIKMCKEITVLELYWSLLNSWIWLESVLESFMEVEF